MTRTEALNSIRNSMREIAKYYALTWCLDHIDKDDFPFDSEDAGVAWVMEFMDYVTASGTTKSRHIPRLFKKWLKEKNGR